jgi:hypothetical protein
MMKADSGYLTRFSPGPGWVTGRPIEEQPGYVLQVRWWKSMRRRGLLSSAGFPVDYPERLIVRWKVPDLGRARKLAASAPFVRRRILRESTVGAAVNC